MGELSPSGDIDYVLLSIEAIVIRQSCLIAVTFGVLVSPSTVT